MFQLPALRILLLAGETNRPLSRIGDLVDRRASSMPPSAARRAPDFLGKPNIEEQ